MTMGEPRKASLFFTSAACRLSTMGWTLFFAAEAGAQNTLPRNFLEPAEIFMDILLFMVSAILLVCLVRLRRSRERQLQDKASDSYRLIAQASGNVAFEINLDTDTIDWTSDLGVDLLGHEAGHFTSDPASLEAVVHEEDRPGLQQLWKDLTGGESQGLEIRLCTHDSRYIWVHLDAVPDPSRNGHVTRAVCVIRKTQDLHEAKEALAEAKRMETVGTMAGGIAHEFNNHLTPIRGFLELALDDLGPDHGASSGLVTALERVEHCADLVAQVQAYGRKSVLRPERLNLPRSLPTIVRLAMSMDRERAEKVTLREQIDSEAPSIWVDQGQFQQAMVQLVRNAMESMPNGGLLTVRTEEVYIHKQNLGKSGGKAGNFMCISVVDSGEGIAPENQEHIFDPFFTTRGRARARGMGLSMVQGMVAQHAGWIEIQSTPGKGTNVRLFLPVKNEEAEAMPAKRPPAAETQPGTIPTSNEETLHVLPAAPQGSRMLVADDEQPVREIIRRVFVKDDWEVDESADANQALESFEANPARYDVVVLDLTMPGPPVQEVVEAMHTLRPELKILLMSGFDRDPRIEKLRQQPNIDFIGKPFAPKQILAKVDAFVSVAA